MMVAALLCKSAVFPGHKQSPGSVTCHDQHENAQCKTKAVIGPDGTAGSVVREDFHTVYR